MGGKPDVILTLTSPPGLPVVGALLAWRHRARLAHWAMDLYPELAIALGEIQPSSVAARLVAAAMRWAYRRATLVVALDDDMRDHLQTFCREEVRVLEPWPAPMVEQQIEATTAQETIPSTPWKWLYSGNLGRAHEWRTLLDAQAQREVQGLPIRLVFQGDGASRGPAMAYAEKLGLRSCEWRGYVAEDELLPALLDAQALIATQRPETCGLLWPSKLALLERIPRPVLFIGPPDGAIARRLRKRTNTGIFAPAQTQAVTDWIGEIYRRPQEASRAHGKQSWPTQKEACAVLARWLVDCAG